MNKIINETPEANVPDYIKRQKALNQALAAQANTAPAVNVPASVDPAVVASAKSSPSAGSLHQQTQAAKNVSVAQSSTNQQSSAPKSTQVSYVDQNGVSQTGYLINGTTYTDPAGTNPVPIGSTVTLPGGDVWYKGANGSYEVTKTTTTNGQNLSDLSPMINQSYDKGDQMIRNTINQQTQQGVDQLNRALQDAQPNYEAAIANQLLEAKQAQDAKAYRNQINGDRGGIGSAQVDSINNTSAKNREAIAAQQRQLAMDTARQIADLRAQGKYEEASQLLQNNQARLSDLYNEQVRLQSAEQSRTESLAALGQNYMAAGLMPNADMLKALGIDEPTAKLYIDLVNAQKNAAGSGSTGGAGSYKYSDSAEKEANDGDDGDDDNPKETGAFRDYVDFKDPSSLSPEAKEMYNKISKGTVGATDAWRRQILDNMASNNISLDDGMFLCKILGISRQSLVQYIQNVCASGVVSEQTGAAWLNTIFR